MLSPGFPPRIESLGLFEYCGGFCRRGNGGAKSDAYEISNSGLADATGPKDILDAVQFVLISGQEHDIAREIEALWRLAPFATEFDTHSEGSGTDPSFTAAIAEARHFTVGLGRALRLRPSLTVVVVPYHRTDTAGWLLEIMPVAATATPLRRVCAHFKDLLC